MKKSPRFFLASLLFLVQAAVFFGALSSARAAEWQWSIADGAARAYLWIPSDCKQVRAVMVANHNMIEQGMLEHPTMRKTLGELGIAEVWVVPAMDGRFDFNQGAGEHFERIMGALAAESGYGELKFAPVIPIGHSACATYPWNFAAWNPGRTLAVLSVHGDAPQTDRTGYGGKNADWGDRNVDGVPGLMVMGEYEWGDDRLAPALAFVAKHPKAPVCFLADVGHGHYDYSDELMSFLAIFVRKAAAARLPETAPLDAPVSLRAVDPAAGWRMERWHKDQSPASAPAAPFAEYKGNAADAFWCFDQEWANAAEAFYANARGKKPQLLSVTAGKEALEKGCGEPVSPRFIPDVDGVTFHLKTAFMPAVPMSNSQATRWSCLPGGSPLARGPGPILLSRSVGPLEQTGPETFVYRPGRAEYTPNRRNLDMWIIASEAGDEHTKSAVQQANVRAIPNQKGATQRITFPEIGDQAAAAKTVELKASSDAGLPISYYVREGPGEIRASTLKLSAIPPRAKFPLEVTVVATQFGRAGDPKIQTAERVERSFFIRAQAH